MLTVVESTCRVNGRVKGYSSRLRRHSDGQRWIGEILAHTGPGEHEVCWQSRPYFQHTGASRACEKQVAELNASLGLSGTAAS